MCDFGVVVGVNRIAIARVSFSAGADFRNGPLLRERKASSQRTQGDGEDPPQKRAAGIDLGIGGRAAYVAKLAGRGI